MITTTSVEEARKQLKTAPTPILILAHDEKFNRALLEHGRIHALVVNHAAKKNDSLRSLDLPVNDVLARIAAKNNISLAFDLAVLRSLSFYEQALELARIIKCIAICRKTGMRLAILNAYTSEGACAFLRTLGASSQQAKACCG